MNFSLHAKQSWDNKSLRFQSGAFVLLIPRLRNHNATDNGDDRGEFVTGDSAHQHQYITVRVGKYP